MAPEKTTLDILEEIAEATYKRTKDPWWKERLEWIKKMKEGSKE